MNSKNNRGFIVVTLLSTLIFLVTIFMGLLSLAVSQLRYMEDSVIDTRLDLSSRSGIDYVKSLIVSHPTQFTVSQNIFTLSQFDPIHTTVTLRPGVIRSMASIQDYSRNLETQFSISDQSIRFFGWRHVN